MEKEGIKGGDKDETVDEERQTDEMKNRCKTEDMGDNT